MKKRVNKEDGLMCCSIVCFLQISEYVNMGKSLSFSRYVVHTKPRSHRSSGAL